MEHAGAVAQRKIGNRTDVRVAFVRTLDKKNADTGRVRVIESRAEINWEIRAMETGRQIRK